MKITDGKSRYALVLGFLVSLTLTASAFAAPAEHILRRFTGIIGDGAGPQAALVEDASGNLYGTTVYGGALSLCKFNSEPVGCGTVFQLSPTGNGGGWTETILHTFGTSGDGSVPSGSLILDQEGNLYGVTLAGGSSGVGTVFELSPPTLPGGAWTETVLYSFTGNGENGGDENPEGALIFDELGNLYGTAGGGGSGSCGTAFELTPSSGGAWTESIIYAFQRTRNNCGPASGLVMDSRGNFYGTTSDDAGSVFKLSQSSGGVWRKTTLHSFVGGFDGTTLFGGLVISKGALYGTTRNGGDTSCGNGCGTVYQITSTGAYRIIHRFLAESTDGILPEAGLIADSSGNLYGTTLEGGGSPLCPNVGTIGCGAVYQLTPPSGDGPWTETTLYGFTGFNGDGASPQAALILDKKRGLLGTTSAGGDGACSIEQSLGCGTVFAITP